MICSWQAAAQSKPGLQSFPESGINRIVLLGGSLAEANPAKDLRPEESLPSSCKNLNENGYLRITHLFASLL
jgi:hypothetical protein